MIDSNNLIIKLKNNYFLTSLIIIIILIIFIISLYYYMRTKVNRVVVFDLDETIGCFQQLGIFCDAIQKFNKKKLSKNDFIKLLELYPEYFRPNLFKIMEFLKEKKINGHLQKVCLYTNNNGPKEWARRICLYIDSKVKYKLFDNHIGAYMVNGEQIEMGRTTHEKTVNDFFRTTHFSKNTEICFIDDLYHEKMDTNNVYYIHVEPYTVALPIHILTFRYYQNFSLNISYQEFYKIISLYMSEFNVSNLNKHNNIDHKYNGEQILVHLQNFLQPQPNFKSSKKYKSANKNNTTLKR